MKKPFNKDKSLEKASDRKVLLAALLLLFAFMVLQVRNQPEQGEITFTSNAYNRQHQDQQFNEELKRIRLKAEYQQVNVVHVNERNLSTVPNHLERYRKSVQPVNIQRSRKASEIINEQKQMEQPEDRRALTPDQRISEKIARDQWAVEYDMAEEEVFIQQFLENARKDGLALQLNENGDVTGLRQIRVDQPIRIPQSSDRPASRTNR